MRVNDRARSDPDAHERRASLIRRIDNLWVGIGLPHRLNETSRSPVELSAEASSTFPKGAHDRLKSLLTIPRNTCSRCGEMYPPMPRRFPPPWSIYSWGRGNGVLVPRIKFCISCRVTKPSLLGSIALKRRS